MILSAHGRIKYPDDYNPVLEYWEEIQSGREVVCQKVRALYQYLAAEIETPGEYYFSCKRSNHVLEFAENYCCQSKGKFGGQLVRLELWEKALLGAAFGFIDINGLRRFREVLLIVGKKNGKSLLASVVGLYMQIADGEPGPECYAVATKKDQAKIVWGEAKRMVNKSPVLRKRIRPLVAEMVSDFNDGVFRPLASDQDTLDGLNVHCGLMDEIHQWKQGKALYDIIADGVTAREQPLIFITSTAGVIREDIYDEKYDYASNVINGYTDPDGYRDDRFLPVIYELDKRSEWTDLACWKKANPGLGTIKNEAALREKVERAKQNPQMVRNLVCKEFNIRETSGEAWLTFDELNNPAVFELADLKPRYGIGGADLSSTTDLTAAKVIFRVPADPHLYVLSMYWLAEDLVEQRVREDKIPYDIWIERGLVRVCPGNSIHPKYVKEWFVEVQEELDIYIPYVGYDSWSAKYWVEDMRGYFGETSMIPVYQGKKTLSNPMKQLGADLRAKLIVYNNNPVDKWCLANTAYEEDRNGNIQPRKTSRRTRRIDGTAALLDAFVVYQEKMEEYLSMI